MDHQLQTSFGVEYQVTVIDPNTKEVKFKTPWCHNLIVNNTGSIFRRGFSSPPAPILGSNGSAVAATQPGVLSPLESLRSISVMFDPLTTEWNQVSDSQGAGVWYYDFDYINVSTSEVVLREIGLPGFSRALLLDNNSQPANIPIAQYDQLSVGLKFTMSFNQPSQTVKIVDPKGGLIDTFDVRYKITPPAILTDAIWWKLFNLEDPITLVHDSGETQIVDYGLSTKVNSRDIQYRLSLMAEDSYGWTGLKYSYACKIPQVEAIFSKTINVPASQKFEIVLNPKW